MNGCSLYQVYYTDINGEILKVTYACKDKSEARRLFLSESKESEHLLKIKKID